jgi:glycerol uptake facilitator-like aquaporin
VSSATPMHPAPIEAPGEHTLLQRAAAEALGTALLVLAVVGSGIAAQRLSPHQLGVELLENAVATGAALVAIILALGPISGAHLNPAVSVVDAALGGLRRGELGAYCAAQLGGGVVGVMLANGMYSLAPLGVSQHARTGSGVLLAEIVATFGLLLVIAGVTHARRSGAAPFAVGAYITGAYFFTSSTSFANPAVAVARMFSDTFAGIAPGSVLGFVVAEAVGALVALVAIRGLWATAARTTPRA